jgi:uncharacterized membrane protein
MNENESENQTANPYAAPTTAVITAKRDESDLAFVAEGKVVSAGSGAAWVGEAWDLFKKNPGIFILCLIIQFVVGIVLSFIPLVGPIISTLAGPVFAAGWIVMAHNAHQDDTVDVGQLFAGLQNKTGELFTVGAIYMGLAIIFIIILGVLGIAIFGTALFAMVTGNGEAAGFRSLIAGGGVLMILFFFLVVFVGSFLLYAAVWFAPALVLRHNVAPMDAIKTSFLAFMKNWLAFIVLGLVYLGLCFASVFTLFLGLLVVIPLLLLSGYTSYRSVFIDD